MGKLILLRHGESQFNLENRFTGWTEIPLTEAGKEEARQAGAAAKKAGLRVDVCFCSLLSRAKVSADLFLQELGADLEPIMDWRLNERHYGALQGKSRTECALLYGRDQVERWRRGYFDVPPLLEKDDPRCPFLDPYFQKFIRQGILRKEDCPLGESLEMTVSRIEPFLLEKVYPELLKNRNILISAHGNSIRGIRKILAKISNEGIFALEIPFGVPYVFEFSKDIAVIKEGPLDNPLPSLEGK